jgi:hypothetical protein
MLKLFYQIYGHCLANKMYPITFLDSDAINLRMSGALVDTQFMFSRETSGKFVFLSTLSDQIRDFLTDCFRVPTTVDNIICVFKKV